MRMCYSIDFSSNGKLKANRLDRLAAIARHNNRKPGGDTPRRRQFATDGEKHRTATNIDATRTAQNSVWINPAYNGGTGGWTAATDLPDDATVPIWAALGGLLGIKPGPDGRLRYGEGKGQRKTKADASAASVARRERRRRQNGGLLVKSDAVLAVDLVVQVSPAAFFPRIREEHWTQTEIDKSSYRPASRGPVDMAAVHDFQAAGLRWAADHFGAERIAEVALHMDEASPHMHIVIIPEKNGKLNAAELIDGSTEAKKMLDGMEPYFVDIHGQRLDRPTEGNPSGGRMYEGLNRMLNEENKALTAENKRLKAENARLADENERLVVELGRLQQETAATTTARNAAAAAAYASGRRTKAADERRKRDREEAERARAKAEEERRRAQEAADAIGLPLPAATAAAACWRAAIAICPDLEAVPAEAWQELWQDTPEAAEALRRSAQDATAAADLAVLLPRS